MDDKKIEEVAKVYMIGEFYDRDEAEWNYPITNEEKRNQCIIDFKAGAKWAINELLKDLWHQTNKEPEGYDEWILLHYNVGNYYSLAQVKDFKSWKGFVEKMPIDGWLYIDDLLPEEGGNQ